MKRTQPKTSNKRKGGAVIIVVVSLLASLVFLGLFFYSWTKSELTNSTYYSETDPLEIDPDPIFDDALQQLIVSTPRGRDFSALYGERSGTPVSHWSMLAHVMGPITGDGRPLKLNPYAGGGVRVSYVDAQIAAPPSRFGGGGGIDGLADDATFTMDYDGDGSAGAFRLNFSKAADGTTFNLASSEYDPIEDLTAGPPKLGFNANGGYSYPDINSLFLSYEAEAEAQDGTKYFVSIPSFHRPQYYPAYRTPLPAIGDYSTLYSDAATVNQVLRPHELHRINTGTGADKFRYVTSALAAQSGDRNRIIEPFPFPSTVSDSTFDADRDGIELEHGVFTNANDISYDYEVDIDRDGIRDSIRMDLDYPIINLPGGRQVVPIFSFKVRDLDGLVDLNSTGNTVGIDQAASTLKANGLEIPFGSNEWISRSNLGRSPSEINPAWALSANPGSAAYIDQTPGNLRNYVQQNHDYFYDNTGAFDPATNALNWREMANMELGWLMFGRETPEGFKIPGRFGETGNLTRFTSIPRPGNSGNDDDLDSEGNIAVAGSHPYGGFPYQDSDLYNLTTPPFVHPTDMVGAGGGHINIAAANGAQRQITAFNGTPGAWPNYDDRWQNQGTTTVHGVQPYPIGLQPGAEDWLTDEADEVIVNRGLAQSNDAIFDASEIAALQLSDADWASLRTGSRVRELAPFNFEFNRQAARIRQRFTTVSADRTEFSMARDPNRTWEFTNWTDGSMTIRNNCFPPQFNTAFAGSDTDPFRPELRRLLLLELDEFDDQDLGPNRTFPQRRLNINRLLDGFDSTGDPVYRQLTPHPRFISTDADAPIDAMVHVNYPTLGSPGHPVAGHAVYNIASMGTDKHDQEFWARYDRQRLARDIFCMLYVLGGADSATNLTNTPFNGPDNNSNSIPDQVEDMAQFAVNYVDALDRDSVITEFEYDYDLSNGWGNNLAKVNGIEAQQLTLSEIMWIRTRKAATDLTRTIYPDDDSQHQFLYCELRNGSPFRVDLRDENWRIVREQGGVRVGRVTFKENGGTAKQIEPGKVFVVSTHDGTLTAGGNPRSSDFYVDKDSTGSTIELIVPDKASVMVNAGDTPPPECHLDLCWDDTTHTGFYTLQVDGTNLATKLVGIPDPTTNDDTQLTFDLVLERRRNLQAANRIQQGDDGLATRGDDWIEVDRRTIDVEYFDADTNADVDAQLTDTLNSIERRQPLQNTWNNHATGAVRNHTIDPVTPENNRVNSNMSGNFTLWQPHFDRDFSSTTELLSVPLYGPSELRTKLATGPKLDFTNTAAGRILFPGDPNAPQDLAVDNRWYRLFEFLEVPYATDDRLGEFALAGRRRSGKMNMNMVRSEQVLAALIDDVTHFDPPNANPERPTIDKFNGNRSWFHEFLVARDGIDSISNLPIPGIPGAAPFLPPSRLNHFNSDIGLLSTTMRVNSQWSVDSTPQLVTNLPNNIDGLGLFEARGTGDLSNDDIDYHTRNRLLDKVNNLTTNRSHVFAVWVQVEFFEAHQPTATTTQIGAQATDLPAIREFVVVDMSRLEDAYFDSDDTSGTIPGTFDFRKFIIHRQRLP